MNFARLFAAAFSLVLLASACGDDGDTTDDAASETTTTVGTTTTEAESTTTEAETTTTTEATTTTTEDSVGANSLPDTPAVASFNQAYTFQQGIPDPESLPAQVGEVEARWYRTPAGYAVVYAGLDASVDACPGNSALTANGFEFVSNAPLPNGVCDEFPTLIENTAGQGVQICDGIVGYLTLIPTDTVGAFFASIEKPDPDVIGVGLTSSVEIADPTSVPEIDPAALTC